jgi:hypothetical protein
VRVLYREGGEGGDSEYEEGGCFQKVGLALFREREESILREHYYINDYVN